MIQDIEEESKTKFSMDVEFSFSFKVNNTKISKTLDARYHFWYNLKMHEYDIWYRVLIARRSSQVVRRGTATP